MTPYRLLVDYEAVRFMESLKRSDQAVVRARLTHLRDDPRRFSDYQEPDSTGRPVDIHIVGKYAIKYWEDHADRQVKILEIHLADRPAL